MIGPDEMDLQVARALADVYVRAMLATGARWVHDNTTEFCKSYVGEDRKSKGEMACHDRIDRVQLQAAQVNENKS
jgi:hypothetical protein